jgi:hypothetical protein
MSLGNVYAAAQLTPDSLKRLCAAVLGQAIDDLKSKDHRQDAYQFLYSPDCEMIVGLFGIEYADFWKRLKKHQGRN